MNSSSLALFCLKMLLEKLKSLTFHSPHVIINIQSNRGITNMNRKQLIKEVLENGHIQIDNGNTVYVLTQINEENFENISPELEEQLKKENKWNTWITLYTGKLKDKYSVTLLPIFGNSEKYVTKWFKNNREEVIMTDLKDRSMKLLKRASL